MLLAFVLAVIFVDAEYVVLTHLMISLLFLTQTTRIPERVLPLLGSGYIFL